MNIAISTCLLDNSTERLNASVLTGSVAPSDLYFSALTKFTYLLTLQKKQPKQYIISCKTVADTLKVTVLDTKTSSAAGGLRPLTPHRRLCPLDPRWGLRPQTPIIGSCSRTRHECVFDPHFSLPSGPLMTTDYITYCNNV